MNFIVKPHPPFDFDLSARIFSDGDSEIHRYEKGEFKQVINVNNNLILIHVKSVGEVDKPELLIDLKSDKMISDAERKTALKIISHIFNLDFNLKIFYEGIKDDPILSKLTEKLRGLNGRTTPTVFEALVFSIVEQQLSLKASHSIERNIIKAFGGELKLKDQLYYAFPTPVKLAALTAEQLRGCGLSFRKSEYIIDISKLIVDDKLDLEKLKECQDLNEIIEELTKLRGVGVWTAELTALRGMHKLEAIPADDLGLRRAISHYYCNDRKISGKEARIIADRWGKWKGLAAFYIIVAEMMDVTV